MSEGEFFHDPYTLTNFLKYESEPFYLNIKRIF